MNNTHTQSNVAILGIGTSLPNYRLDQADTSLRLGQALVDAPDSARWAKRMFKQCGVETRYTCEPNLLETGDDCRYFNRSASQFAPSTADRMETYKRESVPLGLKAARAALLDGKVNASEITHLITVSCTGQFLPGMDTILVQHLGLKDTVNRIPLNFLGCAAGLKAIALAKQLVVSHASAKILVVCVELCTLHIQPSSRREALFGASFFGDGSSACIVGCTNFGETHPGGGVSGSDLGIFQLGNEHSILLPGSAEDMVWEVGNYGFDLYLSPRIPRLIGQYVPEQIEYLIQGDEKPELWAIHPGGKGIIDTLEEIFDLTAGQTGPSRNVLRNYGNMSSATILFVLQEMRQELDASQSGITKSSPSDSSHDAAGRKHGIALAFGPGLSCEMIQIHYVPQMARQTKLLDETYV